ncbi:uncharacterized protein LOC134608197 [Pelobates fuscus]|uniref:uncharacterized protein LOC134608197 n=1 Tax=Pelobates fuscus TaxID=191477 RepID=UPI002FE435D2
MMVLSCQTPLHYFLTTYLLGVSMGWQIEVPQEPVLGLVGDSVLLPVSYFIPQPPAILHITWVYHKSIILFAEMIRCHSDPSISSSPLRLCHKYSIAVEEYRQRVTFLADTASLLLSDLHVNDSGIYLVNFAELNQTKSLTLLVQTQYQVPGSTLTPAQDAVVTLTPAQDAAVTDLGIVFFESLAVRGSCLFIFLAVLLALHCEWWRKVRNGHQRLCHGKTHSYI